MNVFLNRMFTEFLARVRPCLHHCEAEVHDEHKPCGQHHPDVVGNELARALTPSSANARPGRATGSQRQRVSATFRIISFSRVRGGWGRDRASLSTRALGR